MHTILPYNVITDYQTYPVEKIKSRMERGASGRSPVKQVTYLVVSAGLGVKFLSASTHDCFSIMSIELDSM